jgi:hypothetical protein
MPDAAGDLAALRYDDGAGVLLESLTERVACSQEEPAVAVGFNERAAGAVAQCVGVVSPVHCVRRACLTGEVGTRGPRPKEYLVLVFRDLADGQCHAGIGNVVDALLVEPFPRDRAADVRLF